MNRIAPPTLTRAPVAAWNAPAAGAARGWWGIAVHEAGHTVAALVEGMAFYRVVLHGDCQGYLEPIAEPEGYVGAVVLLAGSAAESRLIGTPFSSQRPGRDADFQRAAALVDSATHMRAMYRAFEIVDSTGAHIERIASALLERGELTRANITDIIRSNR